MKEKISFWTYFQTLNWGAPLKNGNSFYFELSVIPMLLLYTVITVLGGNAIPFPCLFAFLCLPAIYTNVNQTRRSPSLFTLLPLGRKRKTAYFFLSVLFTIFVYFITLSVVGLLFALVFFLITLATTGNSIFDANDTQIVEMSVCPQGWILSLCLFFLALGMALLFSSIEKKRLRRIMTLFIPLFLGAPLKILMEIGNLQNGELFVGFDKIPFSFVYLYLFAAVGVALTVVGTIRLVKLLKTKTY